MTRCGAWSDRNSAVQRAPDFMLANRVCCPRLRCQLQRMTFDLLNRRKLLAALGGATAWPLAARAQQGGKIYRIGILEPLPATRNTANLDGLRKGLRNLGYVEGQNLVIEYRSADGRALRFPDLASELVGLNVDLILARGTPATTAVQNATGTIPVVMVTMGGSGAIVASFARPSGNNHGCDYLQH